MKQESRSSFKINRIIMEFKFTIYNGIIIVEKKLIES